MVHIFWTTLLLSSIDIDKFLVLCAPSR